MEKDNLLAEKDNNFIKAVLSGNIEMVIDFINQGVNINTISPSVGDADLSAIYIALEKGHNEIVNLLLDKGASIDIENISENHLLHRVNKKTSLTVAQKIIDKESPESLSHIENSFGVSVIQSMLIYFTPLNIVKIVYDKIKPFNRHKEFQLYLSQLDTESPDYDNYFNQALSFCREENISLKGGNFLFSCFSRNNTDVIKRIKAHYPEELEPLIQEFKQHMSEKKALLSKYISLSDLFSIYPDKEEWSGKNIYDHAIKYNKPHILAYMLKNGASPNEKPLLKLLLEESKKPTFRNSKLLSGIEYGFNELILHKDLKITKPMEFLIQMYISSSDGDESIKLALKQRVSLIEKENLNKTIINPKNKMATRI